ncbi:hypothetical protein [Nitrosomonas sp. Nm33]|uniref:hypothetical protein n=1 Tax=Nitrosomonas sp. Nm33 TaxID=133724 RepID=UPI0008987F9F|nr:hypothetical protein [Nitrosomonas sp. Nm33]SDY95237.1 hypothetical protein SAMN05421755_10712 [Nitrosomonas sp. Nm33]
MANSEPDVIFYNGKITTLDENHPEVMAIALTGGFVSAIGSDKEIHALAFCMRPWLRDPSCR